MNPNPANLDPEPRQRAAAAPLVPPAGPFDLAQMIEAAKADHASEPITIADVAAAAFVALETVVALMPSQSLKEQVIDEFERRAAAFAAEMQVTE
jgi:hypothetical protein